MYSRVVAALALCLFIWEGVRAYPQRGQAAQPQEKQPHEVTITEITDVIAADAKWQKVWQGTDSADGIVGTSDGGVIFAQEQAGTVRKLDKNDKESVFVMDTPGAVALAIDLKNRVLAVQRTCSDSGRGDAPCPDSAIIAIIFPELARQTLVDNVKGKPLGRLNDLAIDKKQTIYFTSGDGYYVTFPQNPKWKLGRGKLESQTRSLGEDLHLNGIVLGPDEKAIYATNGSTILQWDIQLNGFVNNRRLFAKLQNGAEGDGMAIDAFGRIYVAAGTGIQVFDLGGRYVGSIPAPTIVISLAFSGRDKKMLYAVGDDGKTIYKIQMTVQGFKGRAK